MGDDIRLVTPANENLEDLFRVLTDKVMLEIASLFLIVTIQNCFFCFEISSPHFQQIVIVSEVMNLVKVQQ